MRFFAEGHEKIWPYPHELKEAGVFDSPKCVSIQGHVRQDFLDDLREILCIQVQSDAQYTIVFEIGTVCGKESYSLKMGMQETIIRGQDEAGLYYGMQTFIQAASAYRKGTWPLLIVKDWPDFEHRSFMVDMGRSVFSLGYLKRIVRILARLRMNELHLHLYDDELCGIRFEGLPFGSENPFSLSISELAELVVFARQYHVSIVPEMETWAHTGSIVYHYKHLRGGDGVYSGSSLLIGERTFELVSQMAEQVVSVIPDKGTVHFGLDEALWFKDDSVSPDFGPKDMVGRYYEIFKNITRRYKKDLDMLMWADHGGREVPPEIKSGIIIEPWMYWNSQCKTIDEYIERYSRDTQQRWMAGAGQSMAHHRGAYQATRYWCRHAKNSANVHGVNITFWGWNDLDHKFCSLFAGAYYIWNAGATTFFADIEEAEDLERTLYPIMYWWQSVFPEASPDAIKNDRGPVVFNGFYLFGDNHGLPVAPTVLPARTAQGHDYLSEHLKT